MSTVLPDLDPLLIRPTVEQVAALERTRTLGANGVELSTFTTDTRPTDVEVEQLIDQALEAILAQMPTRFGLEFYQRTKHMVCLYAAILIEASYFREQLDSGSVELYRELLREGLITLQQATSFEDVGTSPEIRTVRVRSLMADPAYTTDLYTYPLDD